MAALSAALLLIVNNTVLRAQELPERIVALAEQNAAEGGDAEEMIRRYSELARRRPSINSLSRRELEDCGLFSLFQVESLLDYRKSCGDILSEGELAVVDGFDAESASLCALFFEFSVPQPPFTPDIAKWRHTATLKARSAFAKDAAGVTARYSAQRGSRLALGLSADSDPGELLPAHPVPDFISGYLRLSGSGVLRQVIAGDFSVRAGQGLACWKAFDLKVLGAPASAARQPRGAIPHTSISESGFFRGAAVTLAYGKAEFTLFASRAPVDARMAGDTAYTSIVTDGYHRTEAELAKRHSMHEYAAGAVMTGERGRLRYGLNAIAYRYDKANGRTVREYNRYQQYYGWWGNISADCYLFWRNTRLFAEAALDAGASAALLAGAIWSPCHEFEASLLCRLYSRSYIATHAGAWSSLSSCSNQRGATLSARWIPAPGMEISGNLQYTRHPWSIYGREGPSSSFKYRLSIQKSFGKDLEGSAQISGSPRPGWRSTVAWRFAAGWEMKLRYAGNPAGNGVVAECSGSPSSKVRVTAGGALYATSGWDSRLYLYQSGVPQSFSVATLHGKGAGAYLVVKYAPGRRVEMWLRLSESGVAYFTRIFIPG